MRQRVMIAMALACRPAVADRRRADHRARRDHPGADPRTARRLQAELGMAVILITHDLGVVAETADRVAVMYAGRVVEYCDVRSAFRAAAASLHRGAAGLAAEARRDAGPRCASFPAACPTRANFPIGCRFHPRCPVAQNRCRRRSRAAGDPATGHLSRCCRADEIAAGTLNPVPDHDVLHDRLDHGGRSALPMHRYSRCATRKYFPIKKGLLSRTVGHVQGAGRRVVRRPPGEVLGLVGESGCGKTTAGRCILQLIQPTSGSVKFEGQELVGLPRSADAAAAPTDADRLPGSVLEPESAAHGRQHPEGGAHHAQPRPRPRGGRACGRDARRGSASRRRIAAATRTSSRAASGSASASPARSRCDPRLIVADEPVSALDVSIQAQVVNLLRDLQQQLALTYIFIAHDLSVVKHISDRVAVMYLGTIAELASERRAVPAIRGIPTRCRCSPRFRFPIRTGAATRIVLKGDVPSPANPPSGCRFHTRCYMAQPVCSEEVPPLRRLRPGTGAPATSPSRWTRRGRSWRRRRRGRSAIGGRR